MYFKFRVFKSVFQLRIFKSVLANRCKEVRDRGLGHDKTGRFQISDYQRPIGL